MKVWEYKVLLIWMAHGGCKRSLGTNCGVDHKTSIDDRLNALGNQGWELVDREHRGPFEIWGWFKRQTDRDVVVPSGKPS